MTARVWSPANRTMKHVRVRGVSLENLARPHGVFPTISPPAPRDLLLYFFLILGVVLFIGARVSV
jgi:hypothetical protein